MRRMYYVLLLLMSIISFCNVNAQDLVPLFKIEGSYIEEGWLIIPEFQLKRDSKTKLYHKGNLCFDPKGEYKLCTYEVFEKEYIIITPIDKSKKENSTIFVLSKRNIKIYSLNTQKIYTANVMNKKIQSISEKNKEIIVLGINGKKEIIKMK